MNTTSTDTRDPQQLERESSEIRADMDRTLGALERKFSPGQMLDKSVSYLRDHGGGLARSVGSTVRENPLPILLTAAGIAWLIGSTMRSRSDSYDMYDDPYADDYSSEGGLRQRMSSKLHEGAGAVSDKVHAGMDAARNKWRSSEVSGRMSRTMEATRARAQEMQQRATSMLDEQPLVVGAMALAAGAVLGAALPTTQYENRTVGPMRDRTLDKAREAGAREYQNLKTKLEPKQETQISGRAN